MLIVHLSLPELRHPAMTNEQSTLENPPMITLQKFSPSAYIPFQCVPFRQDS
jgi:hypothetical protein